MASSRLRIGVVGAGHFGRYHALKVVAADPDDDKVLECAQVAGATHIVTGDRKHLLPLRTFQGITILTAADFLAASTPP